MKRLRKIALNLDRSDWPNEYGYAFYLRSRSLCNYIERFLSRVPVNAVSSTKLCITGHSKNELLYGINSSNIASLRIPFVSIDYDVLHDDIEINEFMVQYLRSGLSSIPVSEIEDVDSILDRIKMFVDGGYLNEWVHKEHRFKEAELTASLRCTLTLSDFLLHLDVTGANGITTHHKLLRTDPDELAFYTRFKDVVLEGDQLIVTSRLDEPLYRISLDKLKNQET